MVACRVSIPPHVAAVITHLAPAIKSDVKAALRVLSTDPHAGEPLQRELKGLWKYRARSFRIVYQIVHERRVIRVMAVGHRHSVYDLVREHRVLGATS